MFQLEMRKLRKKMAGNYFAIYKKNYALIVIVAHNDQDSLFLFEIIPLS